MQHLFNRHPAFIGLHLLKGACCPARLPAGSVIILGQLVRAFDLAS